MNAPLQVKPPVLGMAEFVGFLAACMAINALAIDVMLPALPGITEAYGLVDANQAQSVVAVYLLGMGVSQLFYGPLSDSYGRRPVLIFGLLVFSVAGLLATLSNSFVMLLVCRFIQGFGGGAPRVIGISLARDRFSGVILGKVMSLSMMTFMAVPILAPSLGQLVLMIASWRWTFGVLVIGGGSVLLWLLLRLPESLPVEKRRPLSIKSVMDGFWSTVSHRQTMSFVVAVGLVFGAQMGFIISAQRIFADIFNAGDHFGLLFACIASAMAVASFTNSRLVVRLGMQRMAGMALVVLVLVSTTHLAVALRGGESLWLFIALQMATMAMYGFLTANLNALAIEPLGHIAGTASSVIGLCTTLIGAGVGYVIGQAFDGSLVPLTTAGLIIGVAAAMLMLFARTGEERGF
ncbi:multidrug effflux MFS transporter [Spongiibacter sp. KMU-158]|uniref:Bcr/CflA family efflux transporter n=1 Tax=Spongiibacter pelagi TaxID=2760804 RepID=A0A927BZS7_9GAMM|nr:multidrug effflux MFS transporter [Spongiibacter pelagi]MBD2858069.1 multidrug effflux MFS transporter [Spongiibacter pelagi]